MGGIKKIHFVGIKGVGMAPLAIIAKEAGLNVSGCDIGEEFITDESLTKAGISPLVNFSASHLTSGNSKPVDLVVTTGAHGGFGNAEVVAAKEKGIKVLTQGEAVGLFMDGELFGKEQIGISVAGTHGKTTTTAILSTILQKAGLDPSFLIGTSDVPSLGSAGHFGKGKYFVAEADEYAIEPIQNKKAKLLWQHPKIAIITNIEHDHPDLYPSINDVRDVFSEFINALSPDSLLIVCGDDKEAKKLALSYKGNKKTYGFGKDNDYIIRNVRVIKEKTIFDVYEKEILIGEFALVVWGNHNILNATASIIASLACGVKKGEIEKGIIAFTGSKRRSEYIGKLATGALLFDDYAHHPTEISKTLEAFRKRYKNKKIVCIFQPHTYSRTKSLFEEFVNSFAFCDTVILTNIYASLRETKDESISSLQLADKIKLVHKNIVFLPKLFDVVEYVSSQKYTEDTIIITMGAGDIYKINSKLIV